MAFSNHIAAYTVSFVPGALVPLFDVLLKSFPLALLMAVAITALAHFLTRRLLASRVRLVAVLSIYVAALLLTVVVDVLWASAIFDVAPWRLLQPHA